MNRYLQESEVIDISAVSKKARQVARNKKDPIAIAEALFLFVRDLPHSFDLSGALPVSIRASDVLKNGHGICYAKSHLLAAMLRALKIPAGIGYQKLSTESDQLAVFALHAYNSIYLEPLSKWIDVDARGNNERISTRFSTENDNLAYEPDPELGEEDEKIIHPEPKDSVIKAMRESSNTLELRNNLPSHF